MFESAIQGRKLVTIFPKQRENRQNIVDRNKPIARHVGRAIHVTSEFRKNEKHIGHINGTIAIQVFQTQGRPVAIEAWIGIKAGTWIGGRGVIISRRLVLATGALTGVTNAVSIGVSQAGPIAIVRACSTAGLERIGIRARPIV